MSERCVFCGAGERMGRLFEHVGPSEEVKNHFRQSRVEFLKGIRRIIDERIEHINRPREPRGTRVTVD